MADEMIEGRDYYLESGRWVFTAEFLRQRGYCCKSGCRHCPYDFAKEPAREKEPPASGGHSTR